MKVTKSHLVNNPENFGRRVVILGAGACVAALPGGDAEGRILPTMDNLIEVLGLETVLERAGIEYQGRNFEAIYSELYTKNSESAFLRKIMASYFKFSSSAYYRTNLK